MSSAEQPVGATVRVDVPPGSQARDQYIDAAKGIAILLVVIGHARGVPGLLLVLACSFHVPLFFFLAGWMSRRRKDRPLGNLAVALGRGLLVPYACFFLAGYAYWLLTRNVGEKAGRWGDLPWWDPLLGGISGIGPQLYVNPPLWFLPVLCMTALAQWLLDRRLAAGMVVVLALPLAIGWMLWFPGQGVRLPLGVDIVPVALFFHAAGAWYAGRGRLPRTMSGGLGVAAVLVLPWLWLALGNGRLDMNFLRFGESVWRTIPAALAGAAIVLALTPLAARSALLCWAGRNSLLLLCSHILVFFVASGVASVLGLFGAGREPGFAWALGITVVAVVLCVPMRAVLARLAPWALGLRRPAPVPVVA